ncbi:DUF2513 domain-containing protein [Photobacterium damselae]|uniref:DUF2513 domain-containing protein n=1 Tax=Photobacterium damselae TaxID=38293 RepID=UPI0040689BB9
MKIDVSYLKQLLGTFSDSDKAHITWSEIEDRGIIIVDVEPFRVINETFLFHIQILLDNKLISNRHNKCESIEDVGICFGMGQTFLLCDTPLRLTQKGHDFASALANKDVFEKLKTELTNAPFRILFDGSQKLLEHYLTKKLDALLE